MTMLIGALLDRALAWRPDTLAATLDEQAVTFRQLDRRVQRSTAALQALGVRPGDRVAWLADPSLRALDVFLACARAGAVFVPLNPRLSAAEVGATLDHVAPSHFVVDKAHRDLLEGVPLGVEVRSVLIDASTGPAGSAGSTGPRSATGSPFDAAAGDAEPHPRPDPSPDDPHIAYLTSGSTGRPKAALVSHRASWLRSAPGGGTFSGGLRGSGGVVCTFPLYHYGGWQYVMEAWQNLTAIHLVTRADAAHIVRTVERRGASALYCIPAVWERLLEPEHDRADLASLRHADTGTSLVVGDLVARIKRRLPGTTTSILYGSTEAGRMAALHDHDLKRKAGSVGLPAFPGTLWVDDDEEIRVRTPALMSGYLHDPEATAAAVVDGAYRSGDRGRLDEDGYLHITGRLGEMIRTGGEYVAPAEVEQALLTHPHVADVAVVGIPDPQWGEIVCAVVVPSPVATPTLASLRSHLDGAVAGFKHPRRVVVVPTIPRTTATGQVQRKRIRQQLLASVPDQSRLLA
ncbi:acyl--CoA ligase [Nocardioides sp. zg-ZUI104]|uniref:class I adenylate-forming enzyme family protein n=1 Tax=Nocardioides faecalis TaxID=2803858 RepID=UPI001BCFEBD2|nr:class I adenylate-forming enzyme family protein [Nocardioides faecalis]MBS4751938.1 acyl--CoA ligase [Nocardioides faecalis]